MYTVRILCLRKSVAVGSCTSSWLTYVYWRLAFRVPVSNRLANTSGWLTVYHFLTGGCVLFTAQRVCINYWPACMSHWLTGMPISFNDWRVCLFHWPACRYLLLTGVRVALTDRHADIFHWLACGLKSPRVCIDGRKSEFCSFLAIFNVTGFFSPLFPSTQRVITTM